MKTIHKDARVIIDRAIAANMPEAAVQNALANHVFSGKVCLIAIGKAAWNMAYAAKKSLGDRIDNGLVITKYDHSKGDIPGVEIVEAGHPLSDENTIIGTRKAIQLASSLGEGDELLFLISGGGSALFEAPVDGVTLEDMVELNSQLLACGADIVEINTIRKRFSKVKGGRFAQLCAPAKIFAVVLSDVLGDRLDSIASGPAAPDPTTAQDAVRLVEKYSLRLTPAMKACINEETPKALDNVETVITGSVRTLCESAAGEAKELGYNAYVLCNDMDCEAREAGRLMAAMARAIRSGTSPFKAPCAVILGGETIVKLTGKGKGGRNQELALAAAQGIAELEDTVVFSVGSDGTDGPTDAAGGIVDGDTLSALKARGLSLSDILGDNDAYHGLKEVNSLVITGPTGTNVNDMSVILCK